MSFSLWPPIIAPHFTKNFLSLAATIRSYQSHDGFHRLTTNRTYPTSALQSSIPISLISSCSPPFNPQPPSNALHFTQNVLFTALTNHTYPNIVFQSLASTNRSSRRSRLSIISFHQLHLISYPSPIPWP